MSGKKHEHCEMCALTKRIFGNRFAGCADISNHASDVAFKAIQEFFRRLVHEIEAKLASGKISREEYEKITHLISDSIPGAAALVPAMMVLSGVGNAPGMQVLVESNLRRAFQIQAQERLQKEGPLGLLQLIAQAAAASSNSSEDSEEEKEEERDPPSISSLN